jgi:pimeloyl-ACP methyl ester carboxylesterase
MLARILAFLMLGAVAVSPAAFAGSDSKASVNRPTIVLVHGAFAESASWNGVVSILVADGFPVIAAANPLRGLASDSLYVETLLASIPGPIVLVGHSYGGEVITNAATSAKNVKALVYVAGLAPDLGESAAGLGQLFPEGTLGQALAPPVAQADGGQDLYILRDRFWSQFAADVPEEEAVQMAAAQRPIIQSAFDEKAGPPAWKLLPSWFIYGSLDKNLPRSMHAFMAKRANAVETIEIKGASHVVMISHPREVAELIERASSAGGVTASAH